jgi:hypothetical protein
VEEEVEEDEVEVVAGAPGKCHAHINNMGTGTKIEVRKLYLSLNSRGVEWTRRRNPRQDL